MSVVDRSFDHPLKLEERASALLAGGIMLHGYQCGMLWGVTLAAGAQAYRLLGPGPQAEAGAIIAAQRLVESFRARNKYIDCLEITDMNMQEKIQMRQILEFFIKGKAINCFRMAAKYAPVAFSEINYTLSEIHIKAPFPPISCAAMLAQQMGASNMHTVMAAGSAGGIGLSGGGCGALGAAIWIIAMDSGKEGSGEIDYQNPKALDAIDRFMKCTDYEFECSKIVGRRFESVGDHADYLRNGGCSKIIKVLATI
jgi:hypothetical protein